LVIHVVCFSLFTDLFVPRTSDPFPLAVATNSLIINRERIMNIMTFVSTELPTHCLYINVYAELPTQVERYFTTLRFIFFDKRILYYVSRSLHRVDTIN